MAEYSVFLRLNEGESKQQTVEEILAEVDLHGRLRRFQHDFPEWEMWQISQVRGNNLYDVTLGHITMDRVKAINSDPADFGVRDWVVVGFYKGNRGRPFILALGTIPEEEEGSTLVAWPTFRRDYHRTNCLDGNSYTPGTPAAVPDWFLAINREGDNRFEFIGSGARNSNGGVVNPWFLSVDGGEGVAQDYTWLDFSLDEEGISTMEIATSEVGYLFYPLHWVDERISEVGETQYQRSRFLDTAGNVLWTYEAPIREITTGGGGGDPGGGGEES